MQTNVVSHTAVMLRKTLIDKYNIKYSDEYFPCEDYILFLNLIKYTMFYNFQEPLVNYRDYDNTSNKMPLQMQEKAILCKCYARRKYPVLYEDSKKTCWVSFLGIIPFLKYKSYKNIITIYLFG